LFHYFIIQLSSKEVKSASRLGLSLTLIWDITGASRQATKTYYT
jgi:hypothetical protein